MLYQNIEGSDNCKRITMLVVALEDVYFNYGQLVKTASRHDDCLFYMPGFWYRRNLRSPKEAPSFHTSDSWIVREDRLSTPLTAIYDEKSGKSFSVVRIDEFDSDALTTHKEGEVMLSGKHLSDIPDLRIRMEYLHCRLGILIGRLLKHIFVN